MATRRKINWQQVRGQLERNQLELERAFAPDPVWVEKVFRRRAELFASRGSRAAKVIRTPALVFHLGEDLFAIALSQLEGIHPLREWVPVPGAGPELLGVASVRGEARSVLELCRLLRVEQKAPSGEDYVLIVKHGSSSVGVRVAQIARIEDIDMEALSSPVQTSTSEREDGVKGLTHDGVIVIDMDYVLPEALAANGGPASESQEGSLE